MRKFGICRDCDNTTVIKVAYAVFVVLVLIFAFVYLPTLDNKLTKKAKSDKYNLVCQMKNDWKIISKEKIVKFDIDSQYWIFTDGFARNCILEKKNIIKNLICF